MLTNGKTTVHLYGKVSEWLMVTVLKTVDGFPSVGSNPTLAAKLQAGMSELADEADSKSVMVNHVWVQVPLPAPNIESVV